MRLRNVPEAPAIIEASPLCIKEPDIYRGRWHEAFYTNSNEGSGPTLKKPLHIEIGMGKGRFILTMAKENPGINFIGIERYESVLYKAVLRNEENPLPNLRFICGDASFIEAFFAQGEVDRIYLNFSDPWPKERHAKRRLTSVGFLEKYVKVMSTDAALEFKTDNRDLFDYSVETIKEYENLKLDTVTYDLHNDEVLGRGNVMTEYEEKFSARGNRIYKLTARPASIPSDNGS